MDAEGAEVEVRADSPLVHNTDGRSDRLAYVIYTTCRSCYLVDSVCMVMRSWILFLLLFSFNACGLIMGRGAHASKHPTLGWVKVYRGHLKFKFQKLAVFVLGAYNNMHMHIWPWFVMLHNPQTLSSSQTAKTTEGNWLEVLLAAVHSRMKRVVISIVLDLLWLLLIVDYSNQQ